MRIKDIATQIERRNKAFAKMTPKQQRKAIAKDVLKQLEAHKYTAGHVYVNADDCDQHLAMFSSVTPEMFQSIVTEDDFKCHVCALGSAFVSLSRLSGAVRFLDREHDVLGKVFGDQVYHIEMAYEGWLSNGKGSNLNGWHQATEADKSFYSRYPDNDARLVAIFENIVKHGEFRP